jgi:predicted HNH restriction endonuclease
LSAKIEQIVEVIEEVRDAYRARPSTENVSSYRLQAIKTISVRRNIRHQSVNDKFIRKCRPDISTLNDFDKLMERWLLQGRDDLRLTLLKHASDARDRDLVNNSLYLASEPDVALAQEFGFDPNELSFKEAKQQLRLHIIKERNRPLIELAKETWAKAFGGNLACEVCSFRFADSYGEVGAGFIEAHHIVPISELAHDSIVKLTDLVPVCSNCHSMLHRQRPWLRLDQLKEIVSQRRQKAEPNQSL